MYTHIVRGITMSSEEKLIIGKELIDALYEGVDVELAHIGEYDWSSLNDNIDIIQSSELLFGSNEFKFRIKPKELHFNLNGIRLVRPYKPEVGDVGFVLSEKSNTGYEKIKVHNERFKIMFGMWTEEKDIIEVVRVLQNSIPFVEQG